MSRRRLQREIATGEADYRLVSCAAQHPSRVFPYQAVFNHRSHEALSQLGVDIDVVSPTPFAPPVGPYSEYSDIPKVERIGSYRVHSPRFLYALPKRYFYHVSGNSLAKRTTAYLERNFDVPDVLQACSIYLDGYGLVPYAQRHDVPLFVVAHGDVLLYADQLSGRVRRKVHETLDACEGVLCVSEDFAERAERLTDPEKVSVVPIGANPDRFPVERRDEIRAAFGVAPDEPVVLFCGTFDERKGVPELAEAIRGLDDADARFVGVGHSGDHQSTLADALRESDLPWKLRRGVPDDELRKWFAAADLLVLPSHAEGRPTVIYEAMASETAVLGGDAGGIPEQVVDGETGVLVPPGDPAALRDALADLLADHERLREMGRRGYERLVEQGWTWERHAERVTSIHSEALDHHE
ncbi:glycosyltransferase family 4 protein [Halorussus lipolyticus]|uniref:glycosyltransferase family 4 protein n=1 Tax=Halorussus lipolyticus TaxID=3034024 RepID=UPI0023E8A3C3|nr:glycosyltransferase family 4 protein [Halorussus sp. DT80]